MELIVDRDWRVGAVFAHADGSDGRPALAGDDGSSERGQIVLLEDWPSSAFRFSGAGGFFGSETFGAPARVTITMPRAHAPIVAIVIARFLSFRRSFLPPLSPA